LHRRLSAALRDRVDHVKEKTISPDSLVQFLIQWFAQHTTNEDRKVIEFLNASDAGDSA
jgi:hemerythrin